MTRQDLIDEARTLDWFHAIEFGDYVSPGRGFSGHVPNNTLAPLWHFMRDIDLSGLDCLDIGTADGLVAFQMKHSGAARVMATDYLPRRPFYIARDLLGLDVTYFHSTADTELGQRFPPQSFDLIVMAGFLYHLFSPLSAVATCRRLLRPGGLLITETVYAGGDAATLSLNTETEPPFTPQPTTYWVATRAAVEGMLKLSSFDVLGSASLGPLARPGATGRMGHIARAVPTGTVRDRKPQLLRAHSEAWGVPELHWSELSQQSAPGPAYSGPGGHVEIPPGQHPQWVSLLPTVQRVRESAAGTAITMA